MVRVFFVFHSTLAGRLFARSFTTRVRVRRMLLVVHVFLLVNVVVGRIRRGSDGLVSDSIARPSLAVPFSFGRRSTLAAAATFGLECGCFSLLLWRFLGGLDNDRMVMFGIVGRVIAGVVCLFLVRIRVVLSIRNLMILCILHVHVVVVVVVVVAGSTPPPFTIQQGTLTRLRGRFFFFFVLIVNMGLFLLLCIPCSSCRTNCIKMVFLGQRCLQRRDILGLKRGKACSSSNKVVVAA